MRPLREIIRNESAVSLAREMLWRTRREWGKAHFRRRAEISPCPVTFRPVGYYQPNLAEMSSRHRDMIVGFADSVIAGRFTAFGHDTVNLGFPPPWNIDFLSKKSWPMTASDKCNYVRHDGSDVKAVWELSRLQVLPVLGKAYQLTRDETYRAAACRYCADWIEGNPVAIGPNWTVAMEASLRAISVCYLVELLWPMRRDEQDWLSLVTGSLWQHLIFIETHLEFSHLFRGNHYLSNLLGMVHLSLFLQGTQLQGRRRDYWSRMQFELMHQTYEDGGDYEASSGYHALTTQMAGSVLLLASRANLKVKPAFKQRVEQMFDVLEALADPDGCVPQIGDCDDGRVELLHSDVEQLHVPSVAARKSLSIPSLLAFGQALSQKPLTWPSDDLCWYGLSDEVRGRRQKPAKQVFINTGIAIATLGKTEVTFLALPNGIHGKGSHTHNDKLSVLCRIGNSDLLIDPGTGCYTRDSGLRDRFRSTRSHNTVTIDGLEQNTIFGTRETVFCLGNEAAVTPITAPRAGSFSASHSGFERIGVAHTRTVDLVNEHEILISDNLQGSGEHDFEAHFHLGNAWTPVADQSQGNHASCLVQGPSSVVFDFCAPTELHLSFRRSQQSRAYGSIFDSREIVVMGKSQLPLVLSTKLSFSRS
jgi:hypothetical protein